MRVLLIFAPVHPNCDSVGMRAMPPLGLYYLAEILKSHSIEVTAIDPEVVKEWEIFEDYQKSKIILHKILDDSYDVVAFSANSGNWGVSRYLIELLHDIKHNLKIVVGGVHGNYFDQHILKTTAVDVVIRGEGEFSLPSVIKNINNEEALKNIRGITFKTNDNRIIRNDDSEKIKIEDLEKCPYPTYENLPDKKYTHLPLETSRGCKYNCIFCSVVHKKGWRGYCKEIVLERVHKIKNSVINKTIDGRGIYFVDDCFSANQERALELLNELKETGLGFKYGIECRINDLLKDGFLKKLPKDLISFIQIGVEAGYDDGLKKVRKGITVNQVIECSKLIYDSGYEKQAFMSFIIGFPWEGYDEIEETIQTIAYISSTYAIVCNVSWLWICASDLWEQRMEYGITVNDDIYDNPLWITDRTIFDLTHPKISHETYQKVEKLIEAYQQMGYQISHVKMWID